MTITAIGHRGSGVGVSSSAFMQITPNGTVAIGRSLVLVCTTNNNLLSVLTGASNYHTSVSDNAGGNTWSKVGEYCYSPTGASGDGLIVSMWLCNVEAQLTTAHTITFSTNGGTGPTVDKAATLSEFSSTLGTLAKVGTPDYQTVLGANDFGSSTLGGLASAERLYFRGIGKEANTTTALTPTTGFTAITNIRSRNNAAARCAYGEFKIATSTGETSNPTLAVAGDAASVFASLVEGSPPSPGRPIVFVCT